MPMDSSSVVTSPLTMGSPLARFYVTDRTTALGQQIKAIFMNLISAHDTRKLRIEECIAALTDTLFAHAEEIASSEGLQELLLDMVNQTFDNATTKGCSAFQVVFDMQWRDQHEKRSRCLCLLFTRALSCTVQGDCLLICNSIGEVLEENTRSTADMLSDHLGDIAQRTQSSPTPIAAAAACEIIIAMVQTSSTLMKHNPTLLDVLTNSFPALALLRDAVESTDAWHRSAMLRLMAILTARHCYVVSAALAEEVVVVIQNYMRTASDEGQMLGVLAILGRVVLMPSFSRAQWDLFTVCNFLDSTAWDTFTTPTRVAAVLASGKALVTILRVHNECYGRMARRLLVCIQSDDVEVLTNTFAVLEEVVGSEDGLMLVTECVQAIRDCIHRVPHMPAIYPLLEKIRARYRDAAVQPIYKLVDTYMHSDFEFVNYGKLNALLGFLGKRTDLTANEYSEVPIDLSITRKVPVLIRSMPLVTTLLRTSQLGDVVELLTHDTVDVRRQAIETTIDLCELIIADGAAKQRRAPAAASGGGGPSAGPSPMTAPAALDARVRAAVERILDVAVADREPELRHAALHQLRPPFDPYLCLPDNIDALFMARNDTDPGPRDEALVMLCRLHPRHPAGIYQQLLRSQQYMLRDVEGEDSSISMAIYKAGLLQMCAEHNSLLIEPGVIEKVALQRLKRQPFQSKRFSVALLHLVTAVLEHAGPSYHSDAQSFLQPVIRMINAGDSGLRRLAALEALAAIVTTLTMPDPELQADIFRTAARIMRRDEEEHERVTVAAMRVLGAFGAVDPVRIRRVVRTLGANTPLDEKREVAVPALVSYEPRLRLHPDMADRYPSVVLFYLVKALLVSIDPRQQVETLTTVRAMMQQLPGSQKAILLTQLLPQLQQWLRDSEKAHLYEQSLLLMADLAAIMRFFKELIPFSTGHDILQSVQQFCALPQAAQKPLSTYVVQLLDDLAKSLPAQEMRDHRWSVEFIHQRLTQNKSDLDLVQRVVKSLESFLAVMHEKDIQHILPHVVQCIEPAKMMATYHRQQMQDINDACFDFLNYVVVKQLSLVKDCCAMITHTIMWYIELSDSPQEMDMGLHTLAGLIAALKKPGERFVKQVERVAERNGYPAGHFVQMIRTAGAGVAPRPSGTAMDSLNAALPLQLVSHLPRLGQREFEVEVRNNLRINDDNLAVLSVTHPSGQTVILFHFLPTEDRQACLAHFMRKALDSKSTLRRNLGILKVEQSAELPRPVDPAILASIEVIPAAKSHRREQSWIYWSHTVTVLLLKNSPYAALRCIAAVAERNNDLSRDIFPFAAVAVISALSPPDRAHLMQALTRAVELAPYDTKQSLFALAEFMEGERAKQHTRLVKKRRETVFVVERDSPDMRFGINYDQDPTRGVLVTKLAPNGLGAQSGVPVGGQLLAINGKPVRTVSDIRGMIEGVTRAELTIACVVEEHVRPERKILMDIDVLAKVASTSQMHAKAIYFNEVLFKQLNSKIGPATDRNDPTLTYALDVTQRLIEFYGHLNYSQTANGLVKSVTKRFSDSIIAPEQLGFDEIGTLEQLHWWGEALRRYQARLEDAKESGGVDMQAFVGALRCEEALGHLSRVDDMIDGCWASLDAAGRRDVAPYRAKAAFFMGAWDKFDPLVADKAVVEKLGVVERCAALFRLGKHDELLAYTRTTRRGMLETFCESFNESYNRAYDGMVELQNLAHFEELVSYVRSGPDRQDMLQRLWYRRLSRLSTKPANWSTSVSINSLVLSPREDMPAQVMTIRSLMKMQWNSLAGQMLTGLVGENPTMEFLSQQDPEVIHAYVKHFYVTRNRRDAYALLRDILDTAGVPDDGRDTETWGQCWLQLGEWTMALYPNDGDEAIEELLRATELSPTTPAAFHSLGILYYDLSRDPTTPQEVQIDHHVSAIIALFKSVQLRSDHSDGSVMQEILLILSIWFGHSAVVELNEAVNQGIQILPDHVWLHVIPQLIARIGITTKLARAILADLLVRVGTTYPHALIYPLTVAEKSPDTIRRFMAERVLAGIRVTNDQMVKEASLISNEMVRIAILWAEKWHAAIQQAAYKPDNAAAIMGIFAPLYADLDGPNTPNERAFEVAYGQPLRRALAALQEKALDKSWVFFKQVYVQLSKVLSERRLYLSDVSPVLDGVRDSIVAVPGTFEHARPLITIHRFHPRVYVMPSKQKPRRFGLDASNGNKYRFLLKGHEDMRQDERVMQFIGLIDTIFLSDNAASAIALTIPQYAVIPLTDDVGIIGWVENTETIYKMLETYRQEHDTSIYEEVNMIIKMGGLRNIEEYHRLPKAQRKALLSSVMENTPDGELRSIVWSRNDSCEQWLGYRDSYGNSLAAMSMVGYVLGLGDRHLNNLMLKEDGTVVHIDFGDCFEVAMHRALYAEAVPFRLTRLLVAALGITGVDGVYRLTSEIVMKNLRRHSENLLAILEAFIYDPLINWRLTVNEPDKAAGTSTATGGGGGHHDGSTSASGAGGNGARSGVSNHTAASSSSRPLSLGDPNSPTAKEPAMQLSRSFAKHSQSQQQHNTLSPVASHIYEGGDEEIRNQQGDVALARVHAKLTGQDFSISNTSFSLMARSSRRADDDARMRSGSMNPSWSSVNSGMNFGDSPRDSNGAPLLTTYLSLRTLAGGGESLDVQQQVDRLIREATSSDNLADAYLTGWAPFW